MLALEGLKYVGLNHYLVLSGILFTIGMVAVLMRRNVIVILMGVELMLNAVNLSFVAFSHFTANIHGQLMVFFVMTVAAAEAGVGLALAVTVFRRFKEVNIRSFEQLKG
ncbi:MAG: NADH-quinone oxidoreductase subunit NuoK [Bdellovibrionaceae bacterium]|nr:NADH-quinone oxidoreductase subunit NuoK [Bdellovibrionales bacterium]MCB9085480.1 NADH-quinone oxidoreductase subunit NuoK [Pseudobdellovibrionaceae bacterium]